jgi:hypothetical protein
MAKSDPGSPDGGDRNGATNPVDTRVTDTGLAVDHLSEYYRHLTTVSAGAIVVVGAFAGDFKGENGKGGDIGIAALVSLGICVLTSTLMMWAYGVARREVANAVWGETGQGRWAYRVSSRSSSLAQAVVVIGSLIAPWSFIVGFVLLAWYGIVLLR